MALQCDCATAVYDEHRELVRFTGQDGDQALTFAVTRVALEDLAEQNTAEPDEIMRIFNENYPLIEARAAALWQAVKTENERRGTSPSTLDPHVLASLK